MKITIKDKTPHIDTLEFVSYEDVFGKVLLTKGWRE